MVVVVVECVLLLACVCRFWYDCCSWLVFAVVGLRSVFFFPFFVFVVICL